MAPGAPTDTQLRLHYTQRNPLNALRPPIERPTLGVVTPNGAAIRSIRELCGMSLRRLAQLIGRDPGYLSRIEAEQRGATDETLRDIARELQVPLAAITRELPRDQE